MGLASCASVPPPLTIMVPDSLRASCDRPDVGDLATVGDLGALTVAEEAALSVCDGRRGALVQLIDAHKAVVAPKGWWKKG